MVSYNLMPNESVILKEIGVAHGGIWAAYTDELILTNLNIVCVHKGLLGNTKKIFVFPLNQIKRYNDRPQAIHGKLSNGLPALEVYFLNGSESFCFSSENKKKISQWIDAINQVLNGDVEQIDNTIESDDDDDTDTVADAFKEVGDELKDAGLEILDAFGFKPKKKKTDKTAIPPVKITKKCIGCSAPLTGYKGQTVKCKYCDTTQVL